MKMLATLDKILSENHKFYKNIFLREGYPKGAYPKNQTKEELDLYPIHSKNFAVIAEEYCKHMQKAFKSFSKERIVSEYNTFTKNYYVFLGTREWVKECIIKRSLEAVGVRNLY